MSRDAGDLYEQHVDHICRALGYQVVKPACGNQSAWDMVVNGKRLQVKKRCVDQSKPNNIRLVTSLSSSKVVYQTSDVDAFAIYWNDEWFVFPACVIANDQGLIRNGLHMPGVASYRNRWDVLDGAHVPLDAQATLF